MIYQMHFHVKATEYVFNWRLDGFYFVSVT